MAKNKPIDPIDTIDPNRPDTAILIAASWETRCLHLSRNLAPGYRAESVIITVYDGDNPRRVANIAALKRRLSRVGVVKEIEASHLDSIGNVRRTIEALRSLPAEGEVRLLIDTSTYTRKHLLQLLYGLDSEGLLNRSRFYYSWPSDYHTADNEPISKGIQSVRAIEGLAGSNLPSRGSVLVLFVGYEGRRALALWDHLEPSEAIVVIADPPFRPEWSGRIEGQNRFLLSTVSQDRIRKCDGENPEATEALLEQIWMEINSTPQPKDLHIAPLGTQAQLMGIYRFWRKRPGAATLMYVSPDKYRSDRQEFEPGRISILDESWGWSRR